ncbi:transferrin-like [Bombyx mandarina]|uniref:Transferrin-like n=1 Tax=Bombyx mandarina TaxID=7092 RepID=A0A6J2JND2_BOMMA|nr:transferrin-like [Bombyx mandarina]
MFAKLLILSLVFGASRAQSHRVCILSSSSSLCQSLDKDGSQATCSRVETRIDCALRLARGEADIGFFTEEELLLLSQQQPNDNRVIATVRDVSRLETFSFEAVAVVPNNHTGGLDGLRGGRYCHPGFDQSDLRWSPRVLKTLEEVAARTDRCPDVDTNRKTAEEIEVETLSSFFSAACRPGTWSSNSTVDADLKTRFPSLCSLCGGSSGCTGYSIDMGISVAGVNNQNRHIQALECLRVSTNDSVPTVAYAAWLHVRNYFNIRNPQDAASFSLLCPDGTLQALTPEILSNPVAPCSFVKQPWGAIVASTAAASTVLTNLQAWWPTGTDPGANSWQSVLFSGLIGGANARVVFEQTPVAPANYTAPIRSIPAIDSTASCLPAQRWCTTNLNEQTKCSWVRASAYTLGIQPAISCQQRSSVFDCLTDIKESRADFIATPSNYGYIARQHYRLSPVKLVQNTRSGASRVAAFVKETAAAQENITRFENLRGKKACFPEFGGLAYVAFVRTAQLRGVISETECDYVKAVGEFFDGACAPGALDASHTITETTFNATSLCSVCRPLIPTPDNCNKMPRKGAKEDEECFAEPAPQISFCELEKSMTAFSGDDAYGVDTFIKDFEDIANLMQWTGIEKLIYAKRLLKGTAKLFLRSLTGTTTWELLKTGLKEEFGLHLNSAAIHKTISNRKMKPGETYQQYFLQLKELAILSYFFCFLSVHLQALGLQANQFRALCQNNTLAATPGVFIDDNCLLAYVVDAEVLSRRGDPLNNALNVLFDSLDAYFGYNTAAANQLINLDLFSPFNGISDLLFKDSTIGLTEPTGEAPHEPARNYMELFRHLDACSRATPQVPDIANRAAFSVITMLVMSFLTRFVVY